jgi:hypothetical protein
MENEMSKDIQESSTCYSVVTSRAPEPAEDLDIQIEDPVQIGRMGGAKTDGLEVVRQVLLGEHFGDLATKLTTLAVRLEKKLELLEERIDFVEANADMRFQEVRQSIETVDEKHDALDSLVSTAMVSEIEDIKSTMLSADAVPEMLRTMADAMQKVPLGPSRPRDDRVHATITTADLRIPLGRK